MKRSLLASTLLACLSAATAHAQTNIATEVFDKATNTRLELRSVFDPLPPSGYAPVRAIATNGTDRDAVWRLNFNSQTQNFRRQNQHSTQYRLAVPARSTQTADLLVPMAVEYGDSSSYYSGNGILAGTISGAGIATKSFSHHGNKASQMPAIAISKALADSSITKLSNEVQSKSAKSRGYGSDDVFGSRFHPDELPQDWLGLSGFDFLMISSLEWQRLVPGAKNAVLQWVRLGGQLHVYLGPGTAVGSLQLPGGENAGRQPHSLGKIVLLDWDGRQLPVTSTISRYWGESKRVEQLVSTHAKGAPQSPDWDLLKTLGARSFASWQVIVFLVVFGLLVGPVNLFVLAPAGRRHRLFVTTPLLSVGASALMVVLILFQDGTGGAGRRFILVNLEPAETAAYVTQEQVCRTGVLFATGFEVRQPTLIEPLALPNTRWAKLTNDSNSQPAVLNQEGALRGGSFFQSRAEQAQLLRTTVSTRARLELKRDTAADAPPEIVSSLGFDVEPLYFIDADGDVWRLGKNLVTGQSAQLEKSDVAAMRKALARSASTPLGTAGIRLRSMINGTPPRNSFFAIARSAPGLVIETLPSIRWREDQILVFGTVANP